MGKGIKIQVHDKAFNKMLDSKLKRGDKNVQRELKVAGINIETKAKIRVPVDKGILRSSIIRKDTKYSTSVGSRLPYAPYIEFAKPEGTGPHGGPRPYLVPSFKEEVVRFKERLKIL